MITGIKARVKHRYNEGFASLQIDQGKKMSGNCMKDKGMLFDLEHKVHINYSMGDCSDLLVRDAQGNMTLSSKTEGIF